MNVNSLLKGSLKETLRSDDATATRTSNDYHVKLPDYTFYGGRERATTKFYSLSKLEYRVYRVEFA